MPGRREDGKIESASAIMIQIVSVVIAAIGLWIAISKSLRDQFNEIKEDFREFRNEIKKSQENIQEVEIKFENRVSWIEGLLKTNLPDEEKGYELQTRRQTPSSESS